MKTVLNDRILWYDGSCEVDADQIPNLFLRGVTCDKIISLNENEDTQLYNSLEDVPLNTKKEVNNALSYDWKIPEKLKAYQIHELIIDKLYEFLKNIPEDMHQRYIARVEIELNEIYERNLENLFKSLIFVVDTFRENDTVWGVGRGSSCASLCLFLLGVHLIDPVKFNISHDEFFHD
jgi:DNA polymerase III alpha subunit